MPFEHNEGIRNEFEIAAYLNGRKLKDMNPHMRKIMKLIFKDAGENSIFESEKIEGSQKPDIYVKCENETHFISIKSDSTCQVHQEKIDFFVKFLKENNIPNDIIETICYYQWSDGTLDGSGTKRMDYYQTTSWLKERINRANTYLNADKSFIRKFMYRVLFKGSFESNNPAEYVYQGTCEHGVIVSKDEVMIYVNCKHFRHLSTLHVGPITIGPHARYSGVDVKREISRQKVDFRWATIHADMLYISERYRS